MKVCSKCNTEKALTEYHKSKPGIQGRRSDCKQCVRERVANRWTEYQYGISKEELVEMAKAQDYKCKACGTPANESAVFSTPGRNRWECIGLVIDHCHTNGHVRGLLCSKCNSALGFANDNSDTLRNLAQYLDDDKI